MNMPFFPFLLLWAFLELFKQVWYYLQLYKTLVLSFLRSMLYNAGWAGLCSLLYISDPVERPCKGIQTFLKVLMTLDCFFNTHSCSSLLCFQFDHCFSFVCVNIFNGLLMKNSNSSQLLDEAFRNWKVSNEGHLHISGLANLCVYAY